MPWLWLRSLPATQYGSSATESPVLLAIDDFQWLDPSSARVVGFATRQAWLLTPPQTRQP
jgi:hypothetical protein